MKQTLLIHHANLLSFQDGFEKGNDSVLVEGGYIKGIGRYEDFQSVEYPNMQVIDAKGKTLMPGFNDTHIHLWKVGSLKTSMLDLRSAGSPEEMLSMLADYRDRYPASSWITARGFNEISWKDPVLPTAADLDRVIPDKPVYVIRTCAHIAVANSKAMQMAAVDKHTTAPFGGEIQAGADGKPVGIFRETALGLIARHIPPDDKPALKRMIVAAREEMYRYGITAATDPAVHPLLLEAYREMEQAGELGFRLNAIPILLPDGADIPFPIPDYFTADFMTVHTVKFFSDGGLSSKTAALKRSYKNSTSHGVLRLKRNQYLDLCRASMEKGLGIATHAIGDQAIEMVIDVYKTLQPDFPGLLNRIEHLGLPERKDIDAMAENKIATSMQPIFIDELGNNFIRDLDDQYLGYCYPVKSVMGAGVLTALSSDAPVVKNFNPLKGIQAAITRRTATGTEIGASEAIGMIDALKGYTLYAAKLSQSPFTGSLAPGLRADMILLDKDPLDEKLGKNISTQVEKTFVSGKIVWEK